VKEQNKHSAEILSMNIRLPQAIPDVETNPAVTAYGIIPAGSSAPDRTTQKE
jgi:hypothetical protein